MSPPPAASNSSTTIEQDRWFADAVQPHDAQLKAYVRNAFPAVRDVDDVVQECYIRIWKARALHPIRCARAFLFRSARNVSLDLVRRRQSSALEEVGDLDQLPVVDEKAGVPEAVLTAERIALLADALDALPPRSREVVMQCKLEGKSFSEVATELGISEKTVAEHVYRHATPRRGAQ